MLKQLLFLPFLIILCSGCGEINPEGIWQNTQSDNIQYLILKVEEGIAIRKPTSKNWSNFKPTESNKYTNSQTGEYIHFSNPGEMEVYSKAGKKLSSFKRITIEKIDPKIISPQMSKQQVVRFIGEPIEKFNEGSTDMWLFKENFLLAFNEKGVSKMNTNYKRDRDFSKIQNGMNRKRVIDILGNPDEEGILRETGKGFQEWMYGETTTIVFDKQKVVTIRINDSTIDTNNTSIPIKQQFSLVDLSNDKPVGFVIEDQYTEFMKCECHISEEGAAINLKGNKATVAINIQNNNFTAISSYTLNDNQETLTKPENTVDLKLNNNTFEVGKKIIGFIRIEDNCLLEKEGAAYPCYYKGTFECTFEKDKK